MSQSSFTLTLKVKEINQAAQESFTETAFLLSREFTRVITEPRTWNGWGNRDIVDFGQLRSSQQVTFTKPFEVVFSWSVEHSAYVHEGYTLSNGKEAEGRPWTKIALQEFSVQGTFEQLYRQKLNRI